MIHLLPTHTSCVDDDAKAVGRALLARQARDRGQDSAQDRLMAHVAVGERSDVLLGDDHEMHRGERMDVVERENIRVLVDLSAGDLAADDLAEQTIRRIHLLSLRLRAPLIRARRLLVDPGYPLAAAQL